MCRKSASRTSSGIATCLKGAPHNARYDDLLKVLYELFLLVGANGMIALEEHVLEPQTSSISKNIPASSGNRATPWNFSAAACGRSLMANQARPVAPAA